MSYWTSVPPNAKVQLIYKVVKTLLLRYESFYILGGIINNYNKLYYGMLLKAYTRGEKSE